MKIGSVYIAKLKSGRWRRCLLIDLTARAKLIDVGCIVSLPVGGLYRLDNRWSTSALPAMALCCSLWGLRLAAGHLNLADALKNCATGRNLYFQTCHITLKKTRQVRLYCEDLMGASATAGSRQQFRTVCINDALVEGGLAADIPPQGALLTVQPASWKTAGWTWPACLMLPPELEARVVWLDDDGCLYLHRWNDPSHHLDAIRKQLNWRYAGSQPDETELAHWESGEPCVARYAEDGDWNRAIVVKPDDEAKVASVRFIDYGNESQVKYEDIRRELFCFDYPVQAYRVRLERYPASVHPVKTEELDVLYELLEGKIVRMTIAYPPGSPDALPVASDVHLVDGRDDDLMAAFDKFRPEVTLLSVPEPPPPIVIQLDDDSSPPPLLTAEIPRPSNPPEADAIADDDDSPPMLSAVPRNPPDVDFKWPEAPHLEGKNNLKY